MPSTVLVGAQWGDEGKGKITDLIASDYDLRGALPGRQQRRPHRHSRRQEAGAAPDALRGHVRERRARSSATASW